MKRLAGIILSILLVSGAFSTTIEASSMTILQEKENIKQDLGILMNNPDIDKKIKNKLDHAIKQIEKSLDEKYWNEDSTLSFKEGKKVLDADKKAIKILKKSLKDKKSNPIKEDISEIIFRITEIDKMLVEDALNKIKENIMNDKNLKKFDSATNLFNSGNEFFIEHNYENAIKKYSKTWDQIKKIIKKPHIKKIKLVENEVSKNFDSHLNDLDDIYLKVINPKKLDKPKKVEIKIAKECVKGDNHEDAAMKIGFSSQVNLPSEFFVEEFNITNKWFKKYDQDKKIDPINENRWQDYVSEFPNSGDDLIQMNLEDMKSSFNFVSAIPELDGQSGWEGKFEFKGEPGDYYMWFFFPQTDEETEYWCNFVVAYSKSITIDP